MAEMRKVYLLSASLLPLMISSGMVYSVLPIYISSELGANEMQVGLLFTTGAASGSAASILLGRLSDRIGRKPLVVTSQMLFALVMLLYSAITYYAQAFPLHVIEGFAWAMISTSAPAFVADVAGKNRRGEAIGVYNTSWNLGWVIGPTLGGTLAYVYGFRVTLIISFIMIIFGAALTLLLVRNSV